MKIATCSHAADSCSNDEIKEAQLTIVEKPSNIMLGNSLMFGDKSELKG